MTLALVMAGGALGAGARWLCGRWAATALGTAFPWGTFAVNLIGAFAVGVLAAVLPDPAHPARAALGAGVLGGFTTFSAFGLETVELLARGAGGAALAYVAVSVAGGVALAWAGLAAGRAW